MATEQEKAALTTERGRQAAKMTDPVERKNYIAASADVDKDYDKTAQATALKGNQIQRREIMGSMKKAGRFRRLDSIRCTKMKKLFQQIRRKQ